MPLETVVEGIARFAGRILLEIVVELIIKGPGYVLLRVFNPRRVPGDAESAMLGLLFWACIGFGAWLVFFRNG